MDGEDVFGVTISVAVEGTKPDVGLRGVVNGIKPNDHQCRMGKKKKAAKSSPKKVNKPVRETKTGGEKVEGSDNSSNGVNRDKKVMQNSTEKKRSKSASPQKFIPRGSKASTSPAKYQNSGISPPPASGSAPPYSTAPPRPAYHSPRYSRGGTHWEHYGTENRRSPGQRGLRQVLDKYNHDQKPTRGILSLQQQLYQEEHVYYQWSQPGRYSGEQKPGCVQYPDEEDAYCHSWAPQGMIDGMEPIPWRFSSPKPNTPGYEGQICSPKFRRTPGASRPNSRSSNGSSRPSSSCSYRSSPTFTGISGGGTYSMTSSFQPIRSNSPLLSAADLYPIQAESGSPCDFTAVELMVSNLDYNISAREWKKILYTEFQQHIQVLGVYIQTQPDNTNIGFVRVATIEEARFAISQFHRKKIGYKRIHVALVSEDPCADACNVRSEAVALLKQVVGNRLPLFKFIELFEKRYHRGISVSELYRMKDVLEIEEHDGTGRMVVLNVGIVKPEITEENIEMEEVQEILESPVCKLHCREGTINYVDALDASTLPSVIVSLRSFGPQVHTLLQSHNGSMPLMSLPSCYSAEFTPLQPVEECGVPLEHLVTCVPGVKVALSKCGIKQVQWAENKPTTNTECGRFCASPLMNQQMSQFCREIVDLLKHSVLCRMPFSKFIPSYHHHFGRQCRVADYGYTKLMELFEAIPHVVQVLGGGSRRFVTLSHRAQVKRFSSDLLRVLKSQASKQITVCDLPIVYLKVIGKPFSTIDYGVCYIDDLLSEIPETTVLVSGNADEMLLAIPRRDQTSEEIERTKQFALEVVDLLKHSPQCRMPFNKFIPAYHHHFGKQCRVSDYGFTKLIELFEAIPHVLKITEELDEKTLCLTEGELLKVLEEQVGSLLKSRPNQSLPVPEFLAAYMKFHGHSLRLPDFGVPSVVELITKIPSIAKVDDRDGRLIISLVEHSHLQQLAHRILLLLMDQADGSIQSLELRARYKQLFGYTVDIHQLAEDLHGLVQVSSTEDQEWVKLCPLQMFARDSRTLLRHHQGRLSMQQFEVVYAQHFGVSLVPASYGFPSVHALLQAIPHMVTLRGRGHRQTLLLCQDFNGKLAQLLPGEVSTTPEGVKGDPRGSKADTPSNDSGITEPRDEEEKDLTLAISRSRSPCDLLAGPVPSNIPSPDLQPTDAELRSSDLIRFDHSPLPDIFSGLTDEEKQGQKSPLCQTPVSEILHFAAQLLPVDRPPLPASAHHVSDLQNHLQGTAASIRRSERTVNRRVEMLCASAYNKSASTSQLSGKDNDPKKPEKKSRRMLTMTPDEPIEETRTDVRVSQDDEHLQISLSEAAQQLQRNPLVRSSCHVTAHSVLHSISNTGEESSHRLTPGERDKRSLPPSDYNPVPVASDDPVTIPCVEELPEELPSPVTNPERSVSRGEEELASPTKFSSPGVVGPKQSTPQDSSTSNIRETCSDDTGSSPIAGALSPKQGTPKRSRLAARFKIPLSPPVLEN